VAIDASGTAHDSDWAVPSAAGAVRGQVRLPGSKSITNRALILAALADGPTIIGRPLEARDTRLMAGALRALGSRIDEQPGAWTAEPGIPAGHDVGIEVGNAGTVLRFVPPVAALTGADVTFRGDERISQRPVAPLLTALRELGAEISDGGNGAAPFVVHGRKGLPGGSVTMDASSSSQFVSALLLAGARFGAGVQIAHSGPPVPSAPHIEMTVRMLRARGVGVETGPDTWTVLPGPISPGTIVIEPDLSNALPFLAAAVATGGEVTVADWPADSLQAAGTITGLLTAMGADVSQTAAGLRVRGSGEVRGITADLGEVGELTPVLTALAALATSPSEFTGIAHLRRHETDRLAALAGEIGKMGGEVAELSDGLRVNPVPLQSGGVVFDSHDDHRMVMAAAVIGLVTPGLTVRNAATVGKTFPAFIQSWTRLLGPAG
jgi:3-phosphoshikimate 1-carboxyvinyltransferase